MQKIRTFEDLKVWKIAHEIGHDIFLLTKGFPPEEKYNLSDQMIRSSRSISNNIAEGYGRYHFQDNIRFCRISRGSAYELINQLITANACNYIDENVLNTKKEQLLSCIKLLNGYIRYLNKAKDINFTNEDIVAYLAQEEDKGNK